MAAPQPPLLLFNRDVNSMTTETLWLVYCCQKDPDYPDVYNGIHFDSAEDRQELIADLVEAEARLKRKPEAKPTYLAIERLLAGGEDVDHEVFVELLSDLMKSDHIKRASEMEVPRDGEQDIATSEKTTSDMTTSEETTSDMTTIEETTSDMTTSEETTSVDGASGEERKCYLCCETKPASEFPSEPLTRECSPGCLSCTACLTAYLVRQRGYQTHNIICPECICEIPLNTLKKYVSPEIYADLQECVFLGRLRELPGYQVCRHPDCRYGQIHNTTERGLRMQCQKCGNHTCVSCDVQWHEGKTCLWYKYEKETCLRPLTDREAVEDFANFCPGCKIPIQAAAGCGAMECSFCGLEFQWNIKPYEREEQAKAAKAAEKAKAERAARAAEKAKEAEEIEYSAGESDVSMD